MQNLNVKVINRSKHALPHYATDLSAGMDLKANLENAIILQPGERALIPTGIFMELPAGFEAQVRPRSGLSLKHGVTVLNAPGTVDADYRGEVGVILINLGEKAFAVEDGERVAQLVVASYVQVKWEQSEILGDTERGTGGFGSTGKN
jgi:dUTP pyrophosphatase